MILVDEKGNVYILKVVTIFSKSKMIQTAVRKKCTPLPRILEFFFFSLLHMDLHNLSYFSLTEQHLFKQHDIEIIYVCQVS